MTAQDLKNSILQLAVQGKLVPQDPSDEPASELLKRIRAEKSKLILEGVFKKETPLSPVDEEIITFDIPLNWCWGLLDDVVIKPIKRGKSPTYTTQSNTLVFAQKCNTKTGNIDLSLALCLDESKLSKYPENEFMQDGDIVINSTGNGTLGRVGIYHDSDNPAQSPLVPDSHVSVVRINTLMNINYVFYVLKYYQPYIEKIGTGSTNQTELSANTIRSLPFPFPPITEQERIVAKIGELLPLIDEYGEAENLLSELNTEFPDKLHKSILQQAVQGKLTERNPSDEPASELLKRIRVEKAKLIAEGKIKKEKPLPPITDEEKPFEIPDTWEWERVGNLFSVIRGSSPRPKGSPLYWSSNETEFHWVTIKDISDHTQNGVMYKTHEYLTELGSTLSTYVEKGELIVAVSGSTTGKFCVLGINGFIYDGLAAVLNPIKIISSEYLKVFYSWVYQILNSKKIGSAFPNINTDVLKNTLIPIPPLEEQKRIVARVEELLAVCDELK